MATSSSSRQCVFKIVQCCTNRKESPSPKKKEGVGSPHIVPHPGSKKVEHAEVKSWRHGAGRPIIVDAMLPACLPKNMRQNWKKVNFHVETPLWKDCSWVLVHTLACIRLQHTPLHLHLVGSKVEKDVKVNTVSGWHSGELLVYIYVAGSGLGRPMARISLWQLPMFLF